MPARNGQTSTTSDLKWETDSSLTAFFDLSRVRTIWLKCWNHLIGASSERSLSPTNKTKSRSGRNWTFQKCPVQLVYLQDLSQK